MHSSAVYHPQGREVSDTERVKGAQRRTQLITRRLNSRAGVFALSLATWHGMRIVRILLLAHLVLR